MTSDIRERVARAIWDHVNSESRSLPLEAFDQSGEECRSHALGIADAALAAIQPEVLACIPGGDVCNPQQVADDIRKVLGGWNDGDR